MRQARAFMRMSLTQAANRMGYANPSKPCRIETGKDLSIPLWLVVRAAEVYDVFPNFFFSGLEPSTREELAETRELLAALCQRDSAIGTAFAAHVATYCKDVVRIGRSVRKVRDSIKRLEAINPGIGARDDWRALVAEIGALTATVDGLARRLAEKPNPELWIESEERKRWRRQENTAANGGRVGYQRAHVPSAQAEVPGVR